MKLIYFLKLSHKDPLDGQEIQGTRDPLAGQESLDEKGSLEKKDDMEHQVI